MKFKSGLLFFVSECTGTTCFKGSMRFLFALIALSAFSVTATAQEIRKTAFSTNNSSVVVLHIKGLVDEKTAARVDIILNEYRGKILSHVIDKNNNQVSVVISEKMQVTDLLEIFEENGIHAGYTNDRNEFLGLDDDGDLAAPITITK
jgi:hypothetical protein